MNNKLYKGSEIILKSLEKEKVIYIFGYPGGSVLPLYDAIFKNKNIKHILTRHEQAAGHAADGYYRTTGKVGVVFATSGPGATNLVTAIATAQMDSMPMVVITGQVITKYLGKQSFQEAPITEIVKPITKYSKIIYKTENISKEIEKAFFISQEGKKGPVLLDIPKDIMINKSRFIYSKKQKINNFYNDSEFNKKFLKIIDFLKKSKKPIILLGGGAKKSIFEIRKLFKKLEIPITYTLMGKGIISDKEKLNLGMVGMHGTACSNYSIQNCDFLFAIGVRFDDRVIGDEKKFSKNAKIIHLNIDIDEFNKNIKTDIFLHGNSKVIIFNFLKMIYKENLNLNIKKNWNDKILKWKKEYSYNFKKNLFINPKEILSNINKITKGKAILVTEVGQHQMWAARYYNINNPFNFITSGGLGTMGFGLPAAIGAQIGNPKSLVILFAGDGSIQMNIQELITISSNNLPIKIIIINNRSLGMVKQWQKFFYNKNYSCTIFSKKDQPDFKVLSNAYGIKSFKITKKEELFNKLEIAFNDKKPYLIDIDIDSECDVYPMVPSGNSNDKMILKNIEGKK